MAFDLVIPKKVQKEINRIDDRLRSKIIAALLIIKDNPYTGKKLEGDHRNEWAFRVWSYRIIYKIDNHKLIILIVKVGHRQGVYK